MPSIRKDLNPNEVQRLLDAGKSPRAWSLSRFQAYYDGKAYAGRASWWNDAVPLQERAPCIVYPSVRIAIDSNVAFAMGEGKFPQVLSLSSEDDSAFDDALGLKKTESDIVDAFNRKLIQAARLETVFRQAAKLAQASKSVALVLSFRKGLPCADLVPSFISTPTFDPADPDTVIKLEIRYRYTENYLDASTGTWKPQVREYLRIIDAVADTTYLPVVIQELTDTGPVTPDKAQTFLHGFGFCPVRWYAHMKSVNAAGSYDGVALHEVACSQVEALDFSLSQRHRAALYCGDPQLTATGVESDDGFAGQGRSAQQPMLPADMANPAAKQWGAALEGNQTRPGIRKGPGELWRTANPDAKFQLLTLPADALEAISKNATDLRSLLCDSLGVVMIDPSTITGGGDLSGRTLAFVFSKQINAVSMFREDFGRKCILPVICMFYRMLLAKQTGVYLAGLKKVLPILARFNVAVAGVAGLVWFDPSLSLKWGDFFEPSDVDESTRCATALSSYAAGIITLKSAIEHIRAVFAIGDVGQYADTLAKEKAQKQKDAMQTAMDMAGATAQAPPNGAPGAKPAPAAGNPAASASPPAAPPKANRKAPKVKTT